MITELDTINRMLGAAGLAPVSDANTAHPSYRKGKNKLNEVNTDVQSKGYWFNSSDVVLKPTVDGSVYVPQNAAHINTTSRLDSKIVQRGTRMYDQASRSYTIGRELNAALVEIIAFDELPVIAASFIAARAVHEFYLDQGGQEPKLSEFRNMRMVAEVEMKKEQLKNHRPVQPSYNRTGSQGWNRNLEGE